MRPFHPHTRFASFLFALSALVVAGCSSEEPVSAYKVAKPTEVWKQNHVVKKDDAPKVPKDAKPGRMLGAIVPLGDTTWYFKILGPEDPVSTQKEAFDAFIETVKFVEADGAKQPTWTEPEGWVRAPDSDPRNHNAFSRRFATIDIEADGEKLELTVTQLGSGGGDPTEALLANINRWRGQLILSPIEADEISDETTQKEIDGVPFTIVDFSGKLKPRGMGRPPFMQR